MCNDCYNIQIPVCDSTYTFTTDAISDSVTVTFLQFIAGSYVAYEQTVVSDGLGNITIDLSILPGDLVTTAARNIKLTATAAFVYDTNIYNCINIEFIRIYE